MVLILVKEVPVIPLILQALFSSRLTIILKGITSLLVYIFNLAMFGWSHTRLTPQASLSKKGLWCCCKQVTVWLKNKQHQDPPWKAFFSTGTWGTYLFCTSYSKFKTTAFRTQITMNLWELFFNCNRCTTKIAMTNSQTRVNWP